MLWRFEHGEQQISRGIQNRSCETVSAVKAEKNIRKEYGVAKSTMWGWICKYAGLIQKSWEVKGIEAAEEEYIDITMPLKEERNSKTIINTTNESVRIFKNGYSILCHVSKLDRGLSTMIDLEDIDHIYLYPGSTDLRKGESSLFIARKNFLLSNTSSRAESSVIIFSILQTAIANEIDAKLYLKSLIEKIGINPSKKELENLLPWKINLGK